MAELSPDVVRRLEELRALFIAGLPDRVASIAAAAAPLTPALGADEAREATDGIRRLAHQLAGTAGTFGFDTPGEIARGIEIVCTGLFDDATPLSAAQCDDVAQRVRTLEAASAEAVENNVTATPMESRA